jgi:O-glycosyl hydrolase
MAQSLKTLHHKIKIMEKIPLFLTFLLIQLFFCQRSNSQNISSKTSVNLQIDGTKKFQQIDGFGININTAWWFNGEYEDAKVVQPAIDLLVDSLGATIFRAVIEEMDWEAVNDDNDPNNFNWNYYNNVFTNARFQGVWNTLRYLNTRGITDGLIISFMGAPPAAKPLAPKDPKKSWMGGTDYSISPAMEDEFVESIAALLYYARNTAKIQFTLVSPMNETDVISRSKSADHLDGIVEGPNMPDAVQFVRVIKKLAKKLDAVGMSDIRFITPDAAGDHLFASCLNEMIKDSYLIGKIAHWGVHDYGNNAKNYYRIVNNPSNPNKSYWITETAGIDNLFGQLDDNSKAIIFWDGFDCVYQHARRNSYGSLPPNDWVFWIGEKGKPLIEYNAREQIWIPRKQFYEYAQIFKFIKPGAVRVASTNENENLTTYAFLNTDKQLVIVGRNKGNEALTIKSTFVNLPNVKNLELFYTDSLKNLYDANDIKVKDQSFEIAIPANCTFTISGKKNN